MGEGFAVEDQVERLMPVCILDGSDQHSVHVEPDFVSCPSPIRRRDNRWPVATAHPKSSVSASVGLLPALPVTLSRRAKDMHGHGALPLPQLGFAADLKHVDFGTPTGRLVLLKPEALEAAEFIGLALTS